MEHIGKYFSASALMRVGSAVALFIAAYWRNSFQYYTFLRIGVTFVSAYLIYVSISTKRHPWIVVFGFIAVIFNPIIPIKEATKETWAVIDSAAAVVTLASILFVGEKLTQDDENPLSLFKNRAVQIASGLILLIGIASYGVYYEQMAREKWIRDEQIRANANAAVANAANAANAAANAAKKAMEQANLAISQAANQVNAVPPKEAPYPSLKLPCDGHVSNDGGNVVLRSSPMISSDNFVRELSDGDEARLMMLSVNKRWVSIRTKSGEPGWISSKFASCD